jgi:4-methyl-5(b-hydroxyethyl)-thiazole monophosphate biosynthesis
MRGVKFVKVMVPLADGFEEIEAMTIIDVLRRAGLDVETVGVPTSMVTGSHGIKMMTDRKLIEIKGARYDSIVFPGGSKNVETLIRSQTLIELTKAMNANGKVIGAICAAPLLLAKAGILDEKRATIYPGMEKKLSYPRGNKVVIDGNIITSQAPGTAMDFALAVVKKLVGDRAVAKLKHELVVE